jgi:hypothetical protein
MDIDTDPRRGALLRPCQNQTRDWNSGSGSNCAHQVFKIVFGDTSLDGAAAVRVVGQIVGRPRASIAVRRCAFVSPRSTTLLVTLIRLITRRGNDWMTRFPLGREAVNHLKVRSCLIDGEVVCCGVQAGLGGLPDSPPSPKRARPSCVRSICWS